MLRQRRVHLIGTLIPWESSIFSNKLWDHGTSETALVRAVGCGVDTGSGHSLVVEGTIWCLLKWVMYIMGSQSNVNNK